MAHVIDFRKHSLFMISFILIGFALTLFSVRSASGTVPLDFADLAEKLSPTVVNVYTTQTVEVSSSPHQFLPDEMEIPEPFRRFFTTTNGTCCCRSPGGRRSR